MTATDTSIEPWQLVFDDMPSDGFPDGLRLSTDCLARRVIEPIEPDRYIDFPEHLGHRGHGFERIMQEWLLARFGVHAIREVVVPWSYGESHLDLLLVDPREAFDSEGRPVQVELKANKDAQVRSENVRQVQRQMYVMEAALKDGRALRYPRRGDDGEWGWATVDPAVYAEAQWRILVIDPTTWRIPDPRGVKVTLSDERRAELDVEWETMRRFMSLKKGDMEWAIEWQGKMARLGIECRCGKCFRPPLEELPKEVVEHAALYYEAGQEEATAKQEKEHRRDLIKELLPQLVKHAPDKLDRSGRSLVGGGWKVTLAKDGSIRVRPSDAKPTVVI